MQAVRGFESHLFRHLSIGFPARGAICHNPAMKQHMVDLKELDRFRSAHGELNFGKSVSIAPDPDDPGAVLVRNHNGESCGVLPRRGNLCKEILAGGKVGHVSWQSFGRDQVSGLLYTLRVRIVVVEGGEHFEMPPIAEPKQYFVGIVGEASYQPAIRRCTPGQRVHIVHETENPYDKNALVVMTEGGDSLGYIARDCWLQDAIHDEGRGCEAVIKEISAASAGKLRVVLNVSLSGHGVPTRVFTRSPSPKAPAVSPPGKGWLARLFGL